MARRAKPRWGWNHAHDTKDFSRRVSRIDFDWLAQQLDCKGEDQHRCIEKSILTILLTFYWGQFEDCGPSNEEIQSALAELVESATTLSKNLQRLDVRSRSLLSHGYQALHDHQGHAFDNEDLEHSAHLFLKHLSGHPNTSFVVAATILEDAVAMLDLPAEKKSRGPKPKVAIKTLIEDMGALIEEQCQNEPLQGFYFDAIQERFRGKLVKVLEHIIDRFAPELKITNSAIGGQIRRTIGDLSLSDSRE